jgi:uncharacterized protein (DUF2225 family)
MEIYWKITTHYQTIAENLNNYHVSVVDNITNNNPINSTIGNLNKINPLNYLYSAFKQSFTNIEIKNITTDEVQKIIEELKNIKSCGYDEIMTHFKHQQSIYCITPNIYM